MNNSIKSTASIMDAMNLMNKLGEKTLIVISKDGNFEGTVSDGDLRRAILKTKGSLTTSIKTYFNPKPSVLVEGNYSDKEVQEIFKKEKFDLIPILDISGNLIEIIYWNDLLEVNDPKPKLNLPVVIMAGGKGTRLGEFTEILPKPLLPLNNKPIIEHIIGKFLDFGIKDYYITVNYKSKLLKAYFQEVEPEYSVYFFEEKNPRGTAGGLSGFREQLDKEFFLSNCDVVIEADYSEILTFHKENKNLITIVVSANETELSYGVCDIDEEGNLLKINEKPKLNYLVNTGLYLISPKIFKYIDEDPESYLDMNILIENILKENKKIGVFPVHNNNWSDVGQWEEFLKTIKKLG